MRSLISLPRVGTAALWLTFALATPSTAAPPTENIDLIARGDFVVTIDDARPVIEDGAVAVDEGRIVAVGSTEEVLSAYRASVVLPGRDRVLMPGLVNGHTHAAMTLFRGVADDLELIEWLAVRGRRARALAWIAPRTP